MVALFIVLSCLASFAWARKSFFRRTGTTSRARGGLGPLGTLFAIVDVAAVTVFDGFSSFAFALGVFFGVFSLAVFWWSVFSYSGRAPNIASTLGVPSSINTSGPYRYVRHPFYSSYIFFWFSVPVYLVGSVWMIVPSMGFLVMLLLYYRTARSEEEGFLLSPLGEDYRNYSRSTSMFLPGFLNISRQRNA